jgi:hypothetical protein
VSLPALEQEPRAGRPNPRALGANVQVLRRDQLGGLIREYTPTGFIAVQLALMGVIGLIADVLLCACGYAENVSGVD